jgi:hypothetical protein
MSRARYSKDWFYLLSDNALFETEFENLVVQHAEMLRSDAIVVPFKEIIEADGLPSRRADLALVDLRYRFWWVIEVELIGHALEGHVLPQVQTFVEGRYGVSHAAALLRGSAELDETRLRTMMMGEQPRVVVISNRHDPHWDRSITNAGASLAVLKVFRSDQNRDIFVIDGNLPDHVGDCLSDIIAVRGLPSMFRIVSPGALPQPCENKFLIQVDGRTTTWSLMETAKDWFLSPVDVRLTGLSYSLYADDDGVLTLRGK